MATIRRTKKTQLRPVRPNVGIMLAYQKKLDRLITDMQKSVAFHIRAAYRQHPPSMALDDALPTNALKRVIETLKKRWLKQFSDAAPKLAQYFATAVNKRTDASLKKILRDGGFSVRFQQTQAMKDVVKATLEQNVSLIKSIPEQFLKNVEGDVFRSIQRGRDLGGLTKALEKNYGVTHRRAAFIARSQNNLASGAMTAVRFTELGIDTAKWRHSGGGKTKRPSHVANNGKTYKVSTGWYDPTVKKFIVPGELPNCRCVAIPVVPGFS